MSSWLDYGTYHKDGNKIILFDQIKFRRNLIKNPLYIRADGIHFEFCPRADELHGGGAVMQITYDR